MEAGEGVIVPDGEASVDYTLTEADMLSFNALIIRRVPAFKLIMLVRSASVPLIFLACGLINRLSGVALIAALAIVTPLWLLFARWSMRRQRIAMARSIPGPLGPHTMRVTAEGIRYLSPMAENTVSWPAIIDVAESQDLIAILLSKRFGIPVPKRAFEYPTQASTFLRLAREYWAAARGRVQIQE